MAFTTWACCISAVFRSRYWEEPVSIQKGLLVLPVASSIS